MTATAIAQPRPKRTPAAPPRPEPTPCKAELAECQCPEFCERDHDRD